MKTVENKKQRHRVTADFSHAYQVIREEYETKINRTKPDEDSGFDFDKFLIWINSQVASLLSELLTTKFEKHIKDWELTINPAETKEQTVFNQGRVEIIIDAPASDHAVIVRFIEELEAETGLQTSVSTTKLSVVASPSPDSLLSQIRHRLESLGQATQQLLHQALSYISSTAAKLFSRPGQ